MSNLKMYCITVQDSHLDLIRSLNYIPVGLGNNINSKLFTRDNTGKNISQKNPFYGEYTFHYWLWKNNLNKINSQWVGFCQYRKFFAKKDLNVEGLTFEELQNNLIKNINFPDQDFDCILGNQFSVENFKFSKIFRNHLREFISKPSLFFDKKKRNLKFHFDLFHGKGNLDLAIKYLNDEDKKDFKIFMENRTSFNPHNMFICRTDILQEYYKTIFPWLEKCEEVFGFKNLKGYGLQRIYGFLAERFLSYWLNKHYRVKELPIVVKDLSIYKDL